MECTLWVVRHERDAGSHCQNGEVVSLQRLRVVVAGNVLREACPVNPVPKLMAAPHRGILWFLSELRWIARVLISSADRFYWDNGFSKASSLAYTTLLSLVPVTALCFGLLASFAVSKDLLPDVRRFILQFFLPGTAQVDEVINYLSEYSTVVSSLNLLAIVFLVLTAILLINSIEYALNEIWQVYESRSIAQRIGIYSAIIVMAPLLALSLFYFTKLRLEPFLADVGLGYYLHETYAMLMPFFIDFAAFTCLYFLVPKAPVRFRSAIFGAFIGALLFGWAKIGFVLYIDKFSSYVATYQALAAIPIFLFWLYLAWMIVLFGTELSYQAQYLPRTGKLWKRSVLAVGDGQFLLAMQALVVVTRAFSAGKRLPNDLELAEALGCSTVVLKPVVDQLSRKGIVGRAESRDGQLTLLRSPESVTLAAIRDAVFGARQALHYPSELALIFKAVSERASLDEVSLQDIVAPGEAEQKREEEEIVR